MIRIGVISDTHGLLRPEALQLLAGCDHILHGGDIGNASILDQLAQVAPVTAVRGNNDDEPWAHELPDVARVAFGKVPVLLIHDLAQLDIDPAVEGVRVVVSGHSHKPLVRERDGVLYLNPGSAGRRRFKLPIGLAELRVDGTNVTASLSEIQSVR